jgi:toxin CptA
MSSASFDATIDLRPRASLRALTALMLLHGSAGLLMLLAQPPPWLAILLLAGVALSWLRLRRHPVFGFGDKALARLTWHAEGSWTLHDAGGSQAQAQLAADSLVLPGLLVLNFKCDDGSRRSRALLGDELDAELLKQLRARLKLRSGPAGS